MAFPASTITTEQAWNSIRAVASKAKITATALRDDSVVGATARVRYNQLQQRLNEAVTSWNAQASTPGLQNYARDQINNPTLDLVLEYTLMRDAALSLRNWIDAALPRAPSGALELVTANQNGVLIKLTFSTSQTAGFRVEADAFIATIS